MLTPQEVTSVMFEKAVFGGYEISSVDQFLNQLTKDYSALYRDNELLKNRISAMADQIEEYRENEEAMRFALLTAKKDAKELEKKLNAESEAQLQELAAQLDALAAERQKEEEALRWAKERTDGFLTRFREAIRECEGVIGELRRESVSEEHTPETAAEAPQTGEDAPAEGKAVDLTFSDLDFGRD